MKYNDQLVSILGRWPVIPVLTIDDPQQAVSVADALIKGGVDVLKVTLRPSLATIHFNSLAKLSE